MSPLSFALSGFYLSLLILLTACNSGSNADGATGPTLSADCSGQMCAASGMTYTGNGTGIWAAENTGAQIGVVKVALDGIPANAKITLVFTNQSNQEQTFSNDAVVDPLSGVRAPLLPQALHLEAAKQQIKTSPDVAVINQPRMIDSGLISAVKTIQSTGIANAIVGTQKSWAPNFGSISANVETTLRSQSTLSNGKRVNIWVQDSKWGDGKVTQALVDAYAQKFAMPVTGVFDMVASLYGGGPWGTYPGAGSTSTPPPFIDPDQDIQIVMADIPGYSGYFSSGNNYLKVAYAESNEALAFFMDAGDAYDPNRGVGYSAPVLAHEFVHMTNFYQRQILNASSFDSWLEEMSAMALQEMVGSIFNPEDRLGWWHEQWLNRGEYHCQLNFYRFDNECSTYDVAGSFGLYLMRQYGLKFYHDLIATKNASIPSAEEQLSQAITKSDPHSNFRTALRRWGASIALLDSGRLPAGYGYPERVETIGSVTYTLKALNGNNYAGTQFMPSALPTTLAPYAHAPLHFSTTTGRFNRTLALPAYTAVTIVVN